EAIRASRAVSRWAWCGFPPGGAAPGGSRTRASGRWYGRGVTEPGRRAGSGDRRAAAGLEAVDQAAGGEPPPLGQHPGQAGVAAGVGVLRLGRQVGVVPVEAVGVDVAVVVPRGAVAALVAAQQ